MNEQIIDLLARSMNGDMLTSTEQQVLDAWLKKSAHNQKLYDELTSGEFGGDVKEMLNYNSKPLWNKIDQQLSGTRKKTSPLFRRMAIRYAAAAALLILGSLSVYLFFFNSKAKPDMVKEGSEKRFDNDVMPGTDKAVLTLEGGATVVLDDSKKGVITEQNGTTVTNKGTQLEYDAGKSKTLNQPALSYHTLTTPRGGQYQLLLSDGSKVYLNAASSIRFPIAFTGKERTVDITGEVYFEIAKDASKPFKVNVRGTVVEVLGTHFNINAYDDEAVIKTTLLEGKVKVAALSPYKSKVFSQKIIMPGQAASINAAGAIEVEEADVDQAIAWKNGLLVFNHADIQEILRQISRWYDVDVEFKTEIKVPKFYGEIPRTVTLTEVLKIIEINSKLQFTIEGNKVTARQS